MESNSSIATSEIQGKTFIRNGFAGWTICHTSIMMLVICVIYLAHVSAYNFISDDSFITLRYANNLAEGHGLVFNQNEYVEGYTSFLWTILLAGANRAGFDLLASARVLGILFGLITIFLVFLLSSVAASKKLSPLLSGIAPLILALNGSFACWAASGMETMMYVCLITGSFLAVFSGHLGTSAIIIALLLLTRPEGTAIFILLGIFLLIARQQHKSTHLLIWLVSCSSTLAGLFAFRIIYYGSWLPNTYYAKTGGGLRQILRGLAYFYHYAIDHEGIIIIIVLILYGLFLTNYRLRFIALGAAGLWLGVILSGGDGLPMFRFALAPLPLFAVLIAQLIDRLINGARTVENHKKMLQIITICGLSLLTATHFITPITGPYYSRYSYHKNYEIPRWVTVGKWLRENSKKGDSVAAVPIGAIAYYSGLTVYDMMGLTDKHIAHRKMPNMGKGWAGHEKRDGQYILSRRPTYLLLGNIDVTTKPRELHQHPFIPYHNRAIWEREQDFYETDLLFKLYEPRSVQIAEDQFLNFYALRKPEVKEKQNN